MKLLPLNPRSRPGLRASGNDALGMGMDAALTVALFFGIGFAVDRWLGTAPLFMIVGTLVAAVGFFYKFKYRYELEMNRLDAERRRRLARERGGQ